MALTPTATGTTEAPDGSPIAWQRFGDDRAPAVLVANGIGVGWRGMGPQLEHLVARGLQPVTWDYRGLFDSGLGSAGLGIPAHAGDALAVLDHLGLERVPVVGWSMGVNVGFEVVHQAADRVRGVFGIGGVPYSPFRAFVGRGAHRVLRRSTSLAAPVAPLASPVLRRGLPTEAFFSLSKVIRYIRPDTDRTAFLAMASDVASHDHRIYVRTLAELGRHDLRDHLPSMDVPAVLLAGSKDLLIRPRLVARIAGQLPRARAEIVDGCSHFMHLEDAPTVNRLLDGFLHELELTAG